MHRPRRDPWPAAPDFTTLARFGEAEIVQDLAGRLHLRGGALVDQAAARAWAAQFLSGPLHLVEPRRYTVLPRPPHTTANYQIPYGPIPAAPSKLGREEPDLTP